MASVGVNDHSRMIDHLRLLVSYNKVELWPGSMSRKRLRAVLQNRSQRTDRIACGRCGTRTGSSTGRGAYSVGKNPRVVNEFLERIRPERAGEPMGGPLWTRRSLVKLVEA